MIILSQKALRLAQRIAHEVWQKYDDTYNYRTEKQLRNTQESEMIFFWQQFDYMNQLEFMERLVKEPESDARTELLDWIHEWKIDAYM